MSFVEIEIEIEIDLKSITAMHIQCNIYYDEGILFLLVSINNRNRLSSTIGFMLSKERV
jgi:hypothetical protein